METLLYIVLAILILMVMVVIHEFGHYIAGKIFKFKINEFSVGFGPKIISRTLKNGEKFSLRAIPLGGYCAFEGEEESATDNNHTTTDNNHAVTDNNHTTTDNNHAVTDNNHTTTDSKQTAAQKNEAALVITNDSYRAVSSRSFVDEKPWKRLIVFVAGAGFNLISAVIFSFIFILVIGSTPTVTESYKDANSGLFYNPIYAGDEIKAVNGVEVTPLVSFNELAAKVKLGEKVTLLVERKGQLIDVVVTKQLITTAKDAGKPISEPYEGFGLTTESGSGDFMTALKYSVPFTFKMAWSILGVFGQLITGQIPLSSLTGPIGTIGTIAEYSSASWKNILILLPLISANLAVFNLLPIPALDGSKVVFTTIEWIARRPINRRVENIIHLVGFAFIFGLVILIDVIGLFT